MGLPYQLAPDFVPKWEFRARASIMVCLWKSRLRQYLFSFCDLDHILTTTRSKVVKSKESRAKLRRWVEVPLPGRTERANPRHVSLPPFEGTSPACTRREEVPVLSLRADIGALRGLGGPVACPACHRIVFWGGYRFPCPNASG